MAQQHINVGAAPNDGNGDPLRDAFQKTEANFTELYSDVGSAVQSVSGDGVDNTDPENPIISYPTPGDIGADIAGAAAAVASNLSAHIADTTDAHAASAISNTPSGNITATTTQGAVNELDSEKQANISFGTGVQSALGNNIGSAGAPVLFNGSLGTPSSGVATNLTGTASGLTAGNVTTNANLTGDVTSVGNATTLATVNSNTGTYGGTTVSPVITVNAKGLITAVHGANIQIAASDVTVIPFGGITATDVQSAILQLDSRLDGLAWKSPGALCATTANITLSGEQTIDGVMTSASRVLVKDQSTPSQNGIYVSAAGAWARSTDANTAAELHNATISVSTGTSNSNTTWTQTADNITIGSTAISWIQLGTSVPDASGTTKGIAKLYPSTSLGTNTDGAPDQNAVKSYVDTGLALKAPIASPTFTGTATTPNVLVTGQAAASGKKNGIYIDDTGKIFKVSWVEHDTTNRTITEIGVDDLLTTIIHEYKNSSGNSILKILNGQQIEVGGSSFVIEVASGVASGNARFKMNDNQAMCLIFEGSDGIEYLSFKSTNSDERLNISVPQRFRPLIATTADANIDRNVFRFTSGSTNSATELVGSISMPTDETAALVWVRWQALAGDGTVGNGMLQLGVQRASGGTVSAVGSVDDGDGIQRTAGDFVMALAADNTNKRVNLNFTNNTAGAKVFKITAVIESVIVTEPS